MNRWHKEAIKAIHGAKYPYGSKMHRLVRDWCRRQKSREGASNDQIKQFMKNLKAALKEWENEEILLSVMGRYDVILSCERIEEVWFINVRGELRTFMGGG